MSSNISFRIPPPAPCIHQFHQNPPGQVIHKVCHSSQANHTPQTPLAPFCNASTLIRILHIQQPRVATLATNNITKQGSCTPLLTYWLFTPLFFIYKGQKLRQVTFTLKKTWNPNPKLSAHRTYFVVTLPLSWPFELAIPLRNTLIPTQLDPSTQSNAFR